MKNIFGEWEKSRIKTPEICTVIMRKIPVKFPSRKTKDKMTTVLQLGTANPKFSKSMTIYRESLGSAENRGKDIAASHKIDAECIRRRLVGKFWIE